MANYRGPKNEAKTYNTTNVWETIQELQQNIGGQDALKADKTYVDTQLADIVTNVKKFGAKGDGVTDDTIAIQTALNSGAREILFPVGTYVISSTLTIPDYTDLKLAGDNYSWQTTSKVAKLKLMADVDLINLGNHCSVKGGLLDVRGVTNFSKACVKVDYSGNKEISNSKIDTTMVNTSFTGYGVEFYSGSAGTGLIFPFYIKGKISGFQKGVYSHKNDNTTANWFSGLFIDATLENNTQAIDLDFGGNGGKISGTVQPIVTSGGAINATNAPLIRIGGSYILVDAFIWDLGTAVNNIAVENNGKYNVLVGNITTPSKFVKDNQVDPYKLRRIGDNYLFSGTPTNERFVGQSNMNGYQDNILLGAHKKFTINKTLTNVIVGGGGGGLTADGMFMGGDQASYIALSNTSLDGNAVYEITLDQARSIKYVGLQFTERPYRCTIELFSSKTNSYITVVDALANNLFDKTGGLEVTYFWQYDYARDNANFGNAGERNITKIRYTIYLSPSSTYGGTTFCDASTAFAYDGSISFIPPYGGTLYGDLDLNKNKLKNYVFEQGTKPSTPSVGQTFYNGTPYYKPEWYNGLLWVSANNAQSANVGISVAVSASATSLAVAFTSTEHNGSYSVAVAPSWNTTWWITGKSTSGFTINFGTAPSGAATLDWSIRR